jgi:hypothetical protein
MDVPGIVAHCSSRDKLPIPFETPQASKVATGTHTARSSMIKLSLESRKRRMYQFESEEGSRRK